MPRNKVNKLIERYANMSVSDYINKLRIEYSVQLINEHPNWTIDAIAEMCGYVRRATYYSHFNRLFGITPAQYRNERAKNAH
jgi:AraC-like DNA-binding protein